MQRTKTVFRDTYHVWAQGEREQGRNSSNNRSFRDGFAYSYAEPIGRMLTIGGERIVLIRDESFTVTTAKHQGELRSAVSHLTSFTVKHIGGGSYWFHGGNYNELTSKANKLGINHVANIRGYREKIQDAINELLKSRSYIQGKLARIDSLTREANLYCETFKLKTRFAVVQSDAWAKAEKTSHVFILTGEQIREARERESRHDAKQEAKQAAYRARWEADSKQREADRIERQRSLPERIEKWKRNEPTSFSYGELSEDMMRIVGDEVETTRHVRVPLDHVKRAMPIVLRLIERGETYQRNGHSIHVGEYILDRVNADGSVNVGCHTFTRDEVIRFAKLLE